MKKLISLMFMFVLFGMLLIGCSKSPKDAAKSWMQAIEKGDINEANKYSTERTHGINSLIVSMVAMAGDKKDDKGNFKKSLEGIDNARVEIDGDSAKIYTDDNDSKPMTLKKVDGDWKVDVEK